MDVNNTEDTTVKEIAQESKTEKLLNRWLLGSDAHPTLDDFPDSWHVLLEDLSTEKQSVTALGLFGHYQAIREQPHAKTVLPVLPSIPSINAPCISSQHNVYYLTSKLLESQEFVISTLNLISQRGYALPPKDYFTYIAQRMTNNQDAITFDDTVDYQPWQLFWETWKDRLTQTHYDDSLEIDEENWHDFMPAYRRQALSHLRKKDAHAARELIMNCFMQESADERVKILKVLYINLGTEDIEFLKSLSNDRSQKVIATTKNLLTRAGYFKKVEDTQQASGLNDLDTDADAISDDVDTNTVDIELLAEGFSVTNHEDTCTIQTVNFRDHKKRHKRCDLLAKYGLITLADALNITLEQLLAGWQFEKNHEDDNLIFLQCASHLPDAYMSFIIDSLKTYQINNTYVIETIWHRFTSEQQRHLLNTFISGDTIDLQFYQLLMLQTPLSSSSIDLSTLQKSQVWKNMFNEKHRYYLEDNCLALGFLLPESLAKATLEYLQQKLQEEYSVNDPMFYSLRLSVELAYNDEKND